MIDFAAYADSDSKAGRTTIICRVGSWGIWGGSLGVVYVMCGDLYVVASSPAIKTSPHAFLQRYQSVCSGTVSHQPTLCQIGIGPGRKRIRITLLNDGLGTKDQ